ncbi:hypothetical protein PanWU01x14_076080 [Parasponia andersonii]|uniref:RNase H type-1 domain-containing protein n=1 Tax=Parasponia andersonii TaxID=3476 RepID=A0A2P5DD06_PARAD|nr:hypothetical protein PanWU01x14_076080 [Parasponia andersonii]
MGIGAIICDSSGKVMVALSKNLASNLSPKVLEARAPCIRLLRANDVRLPVQSVESNALIVVNSNKNNKHELSVFGDLCTDIHHSLSFFTGISINHVYHSANRAAHGLAQYPIGLDGEFIWLDEVTSPISSVFKMDYPIQ